MRGPDMHSLAVAALGSTQRSQQGLLKCFLQASQIVLQRRQGQQWLNGKVDNATQQRTVHMHSPFACWQESCLSFWGISLCVLRHHPNVRCNGRGACAGKRELPAGMRSRFTELWVAEPGARADLEALVAAYLLGTAPQPPISGVVDFYLAAKAAAAVCGLPQQCSDDRCDPLKYV